MWFTKDSLGSWNAHLYQSTLLRIEQSSLSTVRFSHITHKNPKNSSPSQFSFCLFIYASYTSSFSSHFKNPHNVRVYVVDGVEGMTAKLYATFAEWEKKDLEYIISNLIWIALLFFFCYFSLFILHVYAHLSSFLFPLFYRRKKSTRHEVSQ